MKGSKAKSRKWTLKERAFLGFPGALVMGLGVVSLLEGKLHYQNYWHPSSVCAVFRVRRSVGCLRCNQGRAIL